MKKFLTLLMIGVVTMNLVACTVDSDSTVSDNSVSENTVDISVSGNAVNTDDHVSDKHETVTLSLNSGEDIVLHVPTGHYKTSGDFVNTIVNTYGVDSVDLSRTLFTGSSNTLFGSEQAINCMAFSNLTEILTDLGVEDVSAVEYSTAYTYMKTGEITPGEYEENYKLEELEAITCGSITYRVFEVYYETPTTVVDPETNEEVVTSMTTNCLQVYSDTEDTLEIIIYTGDYNRETALDLLKQFLGI